MENLELLIAGGIILAILVLNFARVRNKPPSETFICARCKKNEKYGPRTTEAWRRGFRKIYCRDCHQLWLMNNPKSRSVESRGSGCLSVLIIGIFVPVVLFCFSRDFY